MPTPSRGFTLVELLVVIAIVAVLLSLLTPTMDRAIYLAELTTCGANQKGVTTGVHQYAMAHRQRYPLRKEIDTTNWRPHQVSAGGFFGASVPGQAPVYADTDLRHYTAGYFSTKMYVDPLCERVDFEPANATWYWSSYNLWVGFKFKGHRGMFKLGDRFAWDNRTYDLLITDRDAIDQFTPEIEGSHPDHDGVLTPMALQDENFDAPGAMTVVGKAATTTISIWWSVTRWDRGPIEMNYTVTDGSVSRIDKALWEKEKDDRIAAIPQQSDSDIATWAAEPTIFTNVPAR